MIVVSAVSLLLIVTLITVILTQCILMFRMKRSKRALQAVEMQAEIMTTNEAYAVRNSTVLSEDEGTYEQVI